MTTWRLESIWTRTLSTTISTSPSRSLGSSLAMAGLSHADPVGRAHRARSAADPAQDEADDDPGDESADVGEQGDAPVRARGAERHDAVDHLHDEREPEQEQRRQ